MIFGYGYGYGFTIHCRINPDYNPVHGFFIFRSELSNLHCNFSLVCAYFILSQVYSNI